MKKRFTAAIMSVIIGCSGITMPAAAQGVNETSAPVESETEVRQTEAVEQSETEMPETELTETEPESEIGTEEQSETAVTTEEMTETETPVEFPEEPETEMVETEEELAERPEARDEYEVIEPGHNKVYTIEEPGQIIKLRVNASDTGEYTLWSEGADTATKVEVGYASAIRQKVESDGDFIVRQHMDAGWGYRIYISMPDGGTGDIRVKFKENEPITGTLTEGLKQYTITEPNQSLELKYAPEEQADYLFWTCDSSSYPSGEIIRDGQVSVIGRGSNEIVSKLTMHAGTEYTYRLSPTRVGAQTFTVGFDRTDRIEIADSKLVVPEGFFDGKVYPFNLSSAEKYMRWGLEYTIFSDIQVQINYGRGAVWYGKVGDNQDIVGNQLYYELEQNAQAPQQYTLTAGVTGQPAWERTVELTALTPEQVSNGTLTEADRQMEILQGYTYYTFDPAVKGRYSFEILQQSNLNLQVYDLDYNPINVFEDQNGYQFLCENGCYIRTYHDVGVNADIIIEEVKELTDVTVQFEDREWRALNDKYQDVISQISLKLTYSDDTTEELDYSDYFGGWRSKYLGYIRYELFSGGDKLQGLYSEILNAQNTLKFYCDNFETLLTSFEFSAVVPDYDNLGELEAGAEKTLTDGTYLYLFTPQQTGYYRDMYGSSYLRYYTLANDKTLGYATARLVAGQRYLLQVSKYSSNYEPKFKLGINDEVRIIERALTDGYQEVFSSDVWQHGTRMELSYTAEKDWFYELGIKRFYGNVQLIDGESGKVLDEKSINDNDSYSFQLEKGKKYLFIIENWFSMYDTFELTFNQKDHDHSIRWETVEAATCGKAGKKQAVCTLCGEITQTETIPATGKHSYGAYQTTRQATCHRDGQQQRVCKVCGHKETARIAATGKHNYGPYRITKEPTAVAVGEKTRSCQTCGRIEKAQVAKLKGYAKLNFSGTLRMQVKQSTTAVKVTMEKGDRIVSWKSSKSKVVSVSKRGKLKAKKTGTAKITITLKSGVKKTFTVKVGKKRVATKSLKADRRKITLKKGRSFKLGTSVTPITSQDKVKFYTSNKKVASVSKKGVVKGRRRGKATITVKSGKKTAKCRVTVK